MSVQVILRDGEPEYAVLPWNEYQALRRAAGQQAEAAPASEAPIAEPAPLPALSELAGLREQAGMSPEQLARAAGISPAYLSMIETGERQPDTAIRRALAVTLGLSGWRDTP